MNKIALFFANAKLLNAEFDILPLIYGSLGLQYLTGDDITADDIDILIPEAYIGPKWNEFRAALEARGYALTDEHEHTFEKDGTEYSYAGIESLGAFAGIDIVDIPVKEVIGARFRLLTLEHYLGVYKASVRDGYRVNVRQKKDAEKIAYIERLLKYDEPPYSHGEIYAIYERLKDKYDVRIDDSKDVDDGFSSHFPVLHGTTKSGVFWLYLYGDLFVLSVDNANGYHDHWHPQSADEAFSDIIDLFEA